MVNNTRRIILCNSAELSKDIFKNNLDTNKARNLQTTYFKFRDFIKISLSSNWKLDICTYAYSFIIVAAFRCK